MGTITLLQLLDIVLLCMTLHKLIIDKNKHVAFVFQRGYWISQASSVSSFNYHDYYGVLKLIIIRSSAIHSTQYLHHSMLMF